MRRFTIILALLAVAALPATALGKPHGTDRPVKGTSTSTTTVDLATGTGISDGSGQVSHLGAFTFHNDFTGFTVTGEMSQDPAELPPDALPLQGILSATKTG